MKEHKDHLLGVTVAKRSVQHLLRTLFIIALILVLCVGAFLMAMHISNLYILTVEGLTLRAKCILQEGSLLDLGECFTGEWIQQDALLTSGVYDNYTVHSFDYRVAFSSPSVMPWSTTATAIVNEQMQNMQGSINSDAVPADAPKDAVYPLPEWEEKEYLVHYVRLNGRWYIDKLEELGPAVPPEVKPTPAPTPVAG